MIFYTKSKSEADKMEKLIENSLSKNIADAITAVDTRILNHPETVLVNLRVSVPVF